MSKNKVSISAVMHGTDFTKFMIIIALTAGLFDLLRLVE